MKNKYLSIPILLACRGRKKKNVPDIHARIQAAIAERKRLRQLVAASEKESDDGESVDIHDQLAATINAHRHTIRSNPDSAGMAA